MNLASVIATNVAGIVLLLIVLENLCHSATVKMSENKLYLSMIWLTMWQSICFIASYVADAYGYFGSYLLALVVNDLLYVGNLFFGLITAWYVYDRLHGGRTISRSRWLILATPTLLGEVGCVVNLVTPVYFAIDPEALTYTRTGLYFVPVLVAFLYFAYELVATFIAKRAGREQLFFPMIIFLIPVTLAMLVEALIPGVSVLMLGVALSLCSIYINVQSQYCSVDPLSGLLTRGQLINRLARDGHSLPEGVRMGGIMMDIDHFKTINDTFGHVVGDETIRAMGVIIREAMPKDASGFRYAGDEFVILQPVHDEQELCATVERLHRVADEYNQKRLYDRRFTFSAGYALYDGQADTFETFVAHMDAAMYEDKQKTAFTL